MICFSPVIGQIKLESKVSPDCPTQPIRLAGFPTTRAWGGTVRVTTLPAPTIANSPISIPHRIVALAPIVAPCRISVGANSDCRLILARGFRTFVNTQDGPRNTSDSKVTPEKMETLFWILQPGPISTSGPTTTFCPSEEPAPIRAPSRIWQKCQIRTPELSFTPSSIIDVGWIIESDISSTIRRGLASIVSGVGSPGGYLR